MLRQPRKPRFKLDAIRDPVLHALFKEMVQQRVTILDVAERSGVSRQTISEWAGQAGVLGCGSSPHRAPKLANVRAVLNVLGLELFVDTIEKREGAQKARETRRKMRRETSDDDDRLPAVRVQGGVSPPR